MRHLESIDFKSKAESYTAMGEAILDQMLCEAEWHFRAAVTPHNPSKHDSSSSSHLLLTGLDFVRAQWAQGLPVHTPPALANMEGTLFYNPFASTSNAYAIQ